MAQGIINYLDGVQVCPWDEAIWGESCPL